MPDTHWKEIQETTEDEDLATRITNYPLTHHTGFIGAQADGELDLRNAFVTDCLYLGYIPMELHEDIMSYAFNLAKKTNDM